MSIPNTWGLKYEEVLSLCWLSYKGNGYVGEWEFPNAGKATWKLKRVVEFLGFRAAYFEGKKKVLAFAGTDSGWASVPDWINNVQQGVTGISPQYLNALTLSKTLPADVVVGHSLGGGLASFVAIYNSKVATTINPAALNIVHSAAMKMNQNRVFNFVEAGEILDTFDRLNPLNDRVGKIHYLPPGKGKSKVDKHSLKNLVGFKKPVEFVIDSVLTRID